MDGQITETTGPLPAPRAAWCQGPAIRVRRYVQNGFERATERGTSGEFSTGADEGFPLEHATVYITLGGDDVSSYALAKNRDRRSRKGRHDSRGSEHAVQMTGRGPTIISGVEDGTAPRPRPPPSPPTAGAAGFELGRRRSPVHLASRIAAGPGPSAAPYAGPRAGRACGSCAGTCPRRRSSRTSRTSTSTRRPSPSSTAGGPVYMRSRDRGPPEE
ncbi:hypothetical protein GGTG_10704 [Gaeumannomyces tritici R3-111a-1]|uniref:Uncharacterized protein n=1 Tax=Gaeumannomyces tritici (strain R3-111a-1) TaxID=644352 RepID=J3PB30_GAET3|nr:hypothetical protein GGTG_10704 [Gaeumannomyces tritici R3-111a-1]EJT71446.1 hypothetical protein GGTG_10704 [Gaeumannomyces tritici R3-111a-1]